MDIDLKLSEILVDYKEGRLNLNQSVNKIKELFKK
jgi:hypothetical protein